MNKAYLLIGSNVGERKRFLDKAAEEIEKRTGKILVKSSLYETEPWGGETKDFFLNRAVLVETSLPPEALLKELLEIENMLGRKRNKERKFGARTVDIDILFYEFTGEKKLAVINKMELRLPHPFLHHRKFTLVPLNEIAANLMHPVLHKSVARLLKECTDKLSVKKLKAII